MEFLREVKHSTMAAGVISSLVIVLLLKSFISWLFHRKRYPPVAGTVIGLLLNQHRLPEFLSGIAARFNTFRFLTPSINYVTTVVPANVEYILKTNFANFGKGSANYEIFKDLLGDGIFAVDGDKWRHQRKAASCVFSATRMRDYSFLVFRSNSVKLCGIIQKSVNLKETIDIQDLFMKLTIDSVFKLGFGDELDTLGGSNQEGTIFAKAFDDSNCQIHRRYVDVFWKIKRFLNLGLEAQLRADVILINNFVYKVIDKKIEQQHDSVMAEDMISRILKESERGQGAMDKQYLRDIVLNILIAGRDTTAATLSWFFYMLCKHLDVQEKLATMVKAVVVGKENLTVEEFSESLNEEVLNGMHYLHAALTETLRLYPAVPIGAKQCLSDDVLPEGFNVNKGDLVFYNPYAMGRTKFLWGDDAELFRPDRWLNSQGFFEPESPFKFIASQAGPRICLGKDFAYRQMKIDGGLPLRASSRFIQ